MTSPAVRCLRQSHPEYGRQFEVHPSPDVTGDKDDERSNEDDERPFC